MYIVSAPTSVMVRLLRRIEISINSWLTTISAFWLMAFYFLLNTSPQDFEAYYALRYKILRQPWGQPPGSERDTDDNSSCHALIKNEMQEAIAVCRLQLNNVHTAQLRYMAVREDMQGKGLGRSLLTYMEEIACEKGITQVVLHARENARDLKCGYHLIEPSYLLWNIIPHYYMRKTL